MLLFLTTNMAAMTSRANQQLDGCPTTKTYILDMFSMARVQTEMP